MVRGPRVYIVAEAGVNHNASVPLAKQLVDVAAAAGADAVKFQAFRAADLVSPRTPMAEYQSSNMGTCESQLEMVSRLELAPAVFAELAIYARQQGIEFLATPFDLQSTNLLIRDLNLPLVKISSGDLTNAPLLLTVAQAGKRVVLSTGMSSLGDIETALAVLAFGYINPDAPPSLQACRDAYQSAQGYRALQDNVVLLHCTTEYPAPDLDVNLRAMDTLATAFGLPVGYSDHTEGIVVPIAAVARGAVLVEKHFTTSKDLPGPDHKASLEPDELKAMVTAIRRVEAALGHPRKIPSAAELKNMSLVRRSLTAARQIKKGEPITAASMAIKRPGTGISPIHYWEWLDRPAPRDYEKDELIGP